MRTVAEAMMKTDFSHLPELAPYLKQPNAMPAGAVGKQGYLRMEFAKDVGGRSYLADLDRRAPLIVQQALYFDEAWKELPCVYILSSGGPQVDGDRYYQEIRVKAGAFAHVSTGAATKLAEMRANYSGQWQHLIVEEDGYLEYLPEPLIPCRHTRHAAFNLLTVHPTATLLYVELLTSGRRYYGTGERFAYDLLSITTQGNRPDGTSLFREKMVLRPNLQSLSVTGIMAGFDVLANVFVVTPPDKAEHLYRNTEPFAKNTEGFGRNTEGFERNTEGFFSNAHSLVAGITQLPNRAGILYKVLGHETEQVKREVRRFSSSVRETVKGYPLPPDFPWR